MATNVVKKSGEKEPFEHKKIVDSILTTGAPPDVAAQIADEVEEAVEEEVSTEQIRNMVLQKLGNIKQEWVDSWKEYEKTKGEE
ncbi:hypothetical protein AKJ48_04060 [candidate division MSBL1 archaeon SCGC-AAA261O19]|uniref:ATP-cone domain-containing protein n=2 Tax=candidate division MSBL1 TaxID=215777 RepID=A0A133UZ13_9EURY|nr:hypothetical protein AKJ42_03230 [candidate division MSBL1 archaeon SCGC-AAA261C02]KXB03251.1 hypothetical protein AKJ48_04060 [candidate division MSBL1 archaeon SCGC-AAA261O19]